MDIEKSIMAALVGLDEFAGSLVSGSLDLTISSRVGMALSDQECGTFSPDGPHGIQLKTMLLCARVLNDIQKDHCTRAWIGDRDRARAVLADLEPYLQRAYAKGIS